MERVQDLQPEPPAPITPAPTPALPQGFLAWASAAGNHAVTAVLSRTVADGSHGSPGVPESDFDPGAATDEQRIAEIRRRLAEGGSLRDVWRSFADIRAAANANAELWKASVARESALAEDEEVLEAFRRAVETIAVDRLSENRDEVWREMDELGVATPDGADGEEQHLAAVAKLQALADEVSRALQLKQVLLQIPVGFHELPEGSHDASDPQGRRGEAKPALFEPGKPPVNRNSGGPGFRSYEAVAREYATVEEVLARGMAHPALFGLVEQAGGPTDKDAHAALRSLAADRADLAQARIGATLHTLLGGIESTTRQIGAGVDFRDLRPVHDQVLAAPPFTGAYERSIAETAIQGHDTMKTLLSFGLAAAQAIALLATPVLGPAALIPIVGAGTVQAGMSYSDYQRLKTARAARTGAQGSDVVSQETVDAAQLQAMLDTVFVFVDGIEGFAAVAKAARLGAKAATEAAEQAAEELPRLATLEPARRDAVLGEAMATMGPGPAIDAAGGIETVRSAAAGLPAAARAEGFVSGLEDRLGHHLADAQQAAATSEPLLPRATAFVAEQAQVPAERALPSLLPARTTEEKLSELVAKRAKGLAAEWVGKSVEARLDMMRLEIRAQAAELGIPPAWLIGDPAVAKGEAYFNPRRWTIALSQTDLERDLTVAELIELRVSIRHELTHSHQTIDAGRYAVFHGSDPNFLSRVPGDIRAEIRRRGPLTPGTPEFERARTFHNEWGPDGDLSRAVIETLKQVREELELARKELRQARSHWRNRRDAVYAAAPGSADEDSAAAEMLVAHREFVARGQAFDAKLLEDKTVYAQYRALPSEADASAAEEAFRIREHERMAAEIKAEVDAEMRELVARGVIVVAGVAAGGYAAYELVERLR